MFFTKLFPTRSPEPHAMENPSAGIDVYMPLMSKKFLDELVKTLPQGIECQVEILDKPKQLVIDVPDLTQLGGVFDNIVNGLGDNKVSIRFSYVGTRRYFHMEIIFNRSMVATFLMPTIVQIPLGLCFDIPKGYHFDLRSKSSNFKNGFTSITGLIDANYTYGIGLQYSAFDNISEHINSNDKIAQLVLIETAIVDKFNELSPETFDKLDTVIAKRHIRTGGFGSTGKQ